MKAHTLTFKQAPVIPAEAGIHSYSAISMDPRLRGDDRGANPQGMKTPIFAANWKCNLDHDQVKLFETWAKNLKPGHDPVILFSSTCYLSPLTSLSTPDLWIGAQDVSTVEKGAYTGEVAAFQLKSLGVKMVLVGHSERRHVFGEDNTHLSQKCNRLREVDIPLCFCVGETQAQRDKGQTLSVVKDQLSVFFEALNTAPKSSNFAQHSLLAYEPVWAIGTGKVATPKDIQEVHAAIKALLQSQGTSGIPVLYGGSVKGSNAAEILTIPGVDGVLVGGASNTPETFDEIRLAKASAP